MDYVFFEQFPISLVSQCYPYRKIFIQTFPEVKRNIPFVFQQCWGGLVNQKVSIFYHLWTRRELQRGALKCICRHLIIYVEPGKSNMHLLWFIGMWVTPSIHQPGPNLNTEICLNTTHPSKLIPSPNFSKL